MPARVIVLLVDNEDDAWDLLEEAPGACGVQRAIMLNPDDPHIVDLFE